LNLVSIYNLYLGKRMIL